MEAVPFVLGIVCLALVFWDAFETIVVPRPSVGPLRIARPLLAWTWRGWRAIGMRVRHGLARDLFYGIYAPAAVVLLLVAWMVLLILGYGLVFLALHDELRPSPGDLGSAMYFAGTSLLTLGFGDVVAAGPLARIVSLTAAATGLGVVALVITFLFSLFGSYQRREVLVVQLGARAKSPPSAAALLVTYAKLGMIGELPALFAEWERWAAEVLDTHVAYPILGYFRSSHDNLSWVSALGAMLDAACLVTTTIRNVPRGQAKLMRRVGAHFVDDYSNYLGVRGDGSIVDRDQFEEVYRKLERVGDELEALEIAWPAFEGERAAYGARLEALADLWAMPATRWTGSWGVSESAVHESGQVAVDGPGPRAF